MLTSERNTLRILGGDKLLDMSCITAATDLKFRKSRGKQQEERKYSMRLVVTEVHLAQGTPFENKNCISSSPGSSAPHDYAIQ